MVFDPLAQQLGVGGGLGVAFVWLVLKFKPWKNGNGHSDHFDEGRAQEIGEMSSDIEHVKRAVDELKRAANENQLRIGELAGNVDILTKLISKHFLQR